MAKALSNKQSLAILVLLVLVAAAAWSKYGPENETARDIDSILNARDSVRTLLRDPNRAEFSRERVVISDGRRIVCGQVNTPNAFGGMAGPRRYAVSAGVHMEGTSSFQRFRAVCA